MNLPRKILHVIGDLDSGGAQTVLARTASAMSKEHFQSCVAVFSGKGRWGDYLESHGVKVVTLGESRTIRPIKFFIRLLRLIKSFQPDLIQGWMYYSNLAVWLESLLFRKSVYVWNLRCSEMDDRHYSLFSRLSIKCGANLSSSPDAIIVNSETGKSDHIRLGYHPKIWKVIPNGFDIDLFRPEHEKRQMMRDKWGYAQNDFVIGIAARYDAMKDHETFFKAASVIVREWPKVKFVLCGERMNSENNELADCARKNGVDKHCQYLGVVQNMTDFYSALDLFTLSSAFGEGFPNVLGEAMSCEIPCVATDVGDARLIVGEHGITVLPRNPESLAEGWLKIMRLNREERAQLGAMARARVVKEYSISHTVSIYENFYQELLRIKN